MFPYGKKGLGFEVVAPRGDANLNAVLAEIEARGIPKVNYTNKERPKFEYRLKYRRMYEPEDFETPSYLNLLHQVKITDDQERDGQGQLLLPKSRLKPTLKIGCVLFHATVVSESVRLEMIRAGLIGVQFKEIIVDGQVSADFWELVSSVTLPPMPHERLVCREISPGDYQNVAGILDGDFLEKEIHYLAAEVAHIEPFDFGLT